jgi:HD-GYP domain-containing protein (c-di-GMP phosphodiesterase class II)
MGLDKQRIQGIRMAATIHDIGKISIPAEILSKPSTLTDSEFELIKSHSQIGHDVVENIQFPWPIADIILQHHCRLDGSGYPNQLTYDSILLEAKIIGVADVVEAISSHRPYRPALGIKNALDEIEHNKGILFDPEVVDSCLSLFKSGRFNFK